MATATVRRPTAGCEVYMFMPDSGRKLMKSLIEANEYSKREVARAAGWKSHTYLLRLLNPEETARTVDPEAAVRLAKFFGVPLHLLFVTRLTTSDDQSDHSVEEIRPASKARAKVRAAQPKRRAA